MKGGPNVAELRRVTGGAPAAEDLSPAESPREGVVVRLADVRPEVVRWLWPARIPLGKLTLLEGNPGEGKTFAALAIAAAITTGGRLPESDPMPAAPVLYVSFEDGLADTLRPRLDRLGADCSRVHALTGWRARGEDQGPITASELDVLSATVERLRPVLVVVDPIQAYLGGEVNMNAANEVRPILSGLARLAESSGAAVVAVRHLRKSASESALFRGMGSIDFAAAARSVLLIARDPDDETPAGGGRVLAQVKSSLGRPAESVRFELREDTLVWAGTSARTAEDLLSAPSSGEERDRQSDAEDWLRHALSDGPRPAGELFKEARGVGIADRTLQRARNRINAKTSKGGARGAWIWSLEADAGKATAPDARHLGALAPCTADGACEAPGDSKATPAAPGTLAPAGSDELDLC